MQSLCISAESYYSHIIDVKCTKPLDSITKNLTCKGKKEASGEAIQTETPSPSKEKQAITKKESVGKQNTTINQQEGFKTN